MSMVMYYLLPHTKHTIQGSFVCPFFTLLDITETSPIKVTPDLHLTYSKNGGNLGLVLKTKTIACLSILLTKHIKYTYLYLFKFVLYGIIAFKSN